jgi:hypothetical protein
MRKLAIATLLAVLSTAGVLAQKTKSWDQWSQKEAQKMLDDSPWGQTQTDTDTSQMFFSPTSAPGVNGARGTSNDSSRASQGATNTEVHVNYHIRFFSAKPIRQAFARMILLNQPNLKDQLIQWSNAHSDEWIIVAVTFDSSDQRFGNVALQAFASATTDLVKNNSYLERKDGKRVFLTEYDAPSKDGSGAKFVFARVLDGKPFLTPDSGEVRFHSEFSAGSNQIKLDRRFKIADMVYDGNLEY